MHEMLSNYNDISLYYANQMGSDSAIPLLSEGHRLVADFGGKVILFTAQAQLLLKQTKWLILLDKMPELKAVLAAR